MSSLRKYTRDAILIMGGRISFLRHLSMVVVDTPKSLATSSRLMSESSVWTSFSEGVSKRIFSSNTSEIKSRRSDDVRVTINLFSMNKKSICIKSKVDFGHNKLPRNVRMIFYLKEKGYFFGGCCRRFFRK